MIQPFHSVVARRRVAGGDPTDFVTGFTGAGVVSNNFTGGIGFKITLNTSVSITHLARWIFTGNSATHTLRIYNGAGTQLQTVSVNASGAPAEEFLFGALPAPVAGGNGDVFYILSDETNAGDSWQDNTLAVTTEAIYSALQGAYNDGSITDAGGQMYGPLSFRYT